MKDIDEEHLIGPGDFMQSSLSETNERLRKHLESQNESSHAGSTGLVVLLYQNKLVISNIGDTRAVLSRNGKAVRVSYDHKPLNDEPRIRSLGGCVITQNKIPRINGALAVSRGIGDFYLEPFVSSEAFVNEEELESDDEFLILACDGVWDEIDDQRAVDIVKSEIQNPSLAATKLRDLSYCQGSDDNIRFVFLFLSLSPATLLFRLLQENFPCVV